MKKGYIDLEVYVESKRLAIEVLKMSLQLPKFELFEEGGQIKRSSKSIATNIAEGYRRSRYKNDFIKHLVFAQAECDETVLHLDFLHQTGSLNNADLYAKVKSEYEILSRKINKFIQWVESNLNDFPDP